MVQWLQFKYKLVKLHCSKSNRRSIAIHTRNCIDTCSTDIINISLCHSVSLSLFWISLIFFPISIKYIYLSPSLFVYLSRSLSCTDILVFEKKNTTTGIYYYVLTYDMQLELFIKAVYRLKDIQLSVMMYTDRLCMLT